MFSFSSEDPVNFSQQITGRLDNYAKSLLLAWMSVALLYKRYGYAATLILDLTFDPPTADHQQVSRAIAKLFDCLRRRGYMKDYWYVREYHTNSRNEIHVHAVLGMTWPVRDDCDMQREQQLGVPMTILKTYIHGERFREFTQELEEMLPRHGFGRYTAWPIKVGAEAVASYHTKDLLKNLRCRDKSDRNVRYWNCSKGVRAGSTRFSWDTPWSRAHRRAKARFAATFKCNDLDDLYRIAGPTWYFNNRDEIFRYTLEEYEKMKGSTNV